MSSNNHSSKLLFKTAAGVLCISILFSTTASAEWGTSDNVKTWNTEGEVSTQTDDYVPADKAEEQRKEEKNQQSKNEQAIKEKKAQVAGMESDLKDLKSEQKQLEAKINNASGQKKEQQSIKNDLSAKVENVTTQARILEERIAILNETIAMTEENIEEKKKDINESVLLLRERMLVSYKAGYSSPISVVLGAETYYDSLVRTKVITQIADHDKKLVDRLSSERKELEEEESSLKEDKVAIESDKAELEASRVQLNSDIKKADIEIENISQLQNQYTEDLEESKKKAKKMESDMQNVYSQIKNLSSSATSTYSGGQMAWPLPNYSTISSAYGWRFGGSNLHTGVDITGGGCNGANIVAANDGKVVKANWSYTPGQSYGIYVMIDHGGGMTTLYGHCSNLLVTEGQEVKRGQAIANVGSTGWSTGPHLHFEVRKDGAHTNPLPYLKG